MMQHLAHLPVVLLPASSGGRSGAALFEGLSSPGEALPPMQDGSGEFASRLAGVMEGGSELPLDGEHLPLQPQTAQPVARTREWLTKMPVDPTLEGAYRGDGVGVLQRDPDAALPRGSDPLNIRTPGQSREMEEDAPPVSRPGTVDGRTVDGTELAMASGHGTPSAPLQLVESTPEGAYRGDDAGGVLQRDPDAALLRGSDPLNIHTPGQPTEAEESAVDGGSIARTELAMTSVQGIPSYRMKLMDPVPENGKGADGAAADSAGQPATVQVNSTHPPLPPMPSLDSQAAASLSVDEGNLIRPGVANGEALQRFAEQWTRRFDGRERQAPERTNPSPMPTLNSSMGSPAAGQGQLSSSAELMQAWQSQLQATQSQQGQSQQTAGTLFNTGQSGQASPNQGSAQSASASPQSGHVMDPALSAQRTLMDSSGLAQSGAREQWGDALSRRIQMMTAQHRSEAHIRLDPPELGRLMIQIQMNAEQMSIQFTSPHALVREALEGSLPRLQESLAEEGLDLLDVDISDQSAEQDSGESSEGHQAPGDGAGADGGDEPVVGDERMTAAALSLVDAYA